MSLAPLTWLAALGCGRAVGVDPPLGPERALTTAAATLRYPSSWGAQLDPAGAVTLGPERCAVEVTRIAAGEHGPLDAVADGLARVRADYGDDATFTRGSAVVGVREGPWFDRPAVVATTRARTARWPFGEVLDVEVAVLPSTRTADGVLAIVSTCAGRGQLDALRPGLAVVAASVAPRSGPVPPIRADHVALAVPTEGWAVAIDGRREELFAYAVGGPICAVRVGWSPVDPGEALVAERMREAFVADEAGDWSTTRVADLDGQRWYAETSDGTVTHRSDVRVAPLDGGAVYVATTAAEYEPCDPRFEAVLRGFTVIRSP